MKRLWDMYHVQKVQWKKQRESLFCITVARKIGKAQCVMGRIQKTGTSACEKGERKGRWGKGEGEKQWNPPPLPLSPSLFDAWRNPAPCWILKKSRFALTPSAKLLFLQSQSSRQPFCYCPQSSMTTTALRTNMNKQLSPAQKIRLCYIPKHDAR